MVLIEGIFEKHTNLIASLRVCLLFSRLYISNLVLILLTCFLICGVIFVWSQWFDCILQNLKNSFKIEQSRLLLVDGVEDSDDAWLGLGSRLRSMLGLRLEWLPFSNMFRCSTEKLSFEGCLGLGIRVRRGVSVRVWKDASGAHAANASASLLTSESHAPDIHAQIMHPMKQSSSERPSHTLFWGPLYLLNLTLILSP